MMGIGSNVTMSTTHAQSLYKAMPAKKRRTFLVEWLNFNLFCVMETSQSYIQDAPQPANQLWLDFQPL